MSRWSESYRHAGPSINVPVKLIGAIGAKGAILLSQLFFWNGKQASKEGWIYKTQRDLENETCLSLHELNKCVADLKETKVLETNYDRGAHRLYYRINFEVLDAIMEEHANSCVSGEAHTESVFREIRKAHFAIKKQENTTGDHDRAQAREGKSFPSSQTDTGPAARAVGSNGSAASKGKSETPIVVAAALQTEAFLSAWADFDAHRQTLLPKVPWTRRAKELIMKKCEELGEQAAIDALNESIMNGWRGLFPKGNKNNEQSLTPEQAERKMNEYLYRL